MGEVCQAQFPAMSTIRAFHLNRANTSGRGALAFSTPSGSTAITVAANFGADGWATVNITLDCPDGEVVRAVVTHAGGGVQNIGNLPGFISSLIDVKVLN